MTLFPPVHNQNQGIPGAPNSGLQKVLVSELKGRQLSSEFGGSQIKRLKNDMKLNGFNENFRIDIAVVDVRKIIIDGHHRARAAGAAGIKEVPVRVHVVTPEEGLALNQA